MMNTDSAIRNMFAKVMVFVSNMLGPWSKFWTLRDLDLMQLMLSWNTLQWNLGFGLWNSKTEPISGIRFIKGRASHIAWDKAIYSASVVSSTKRDFSLQLARPRILIGHVSGMRKNAFRVVHIARRPTAGKEPSSRIRFVMDTLILRAKQISRNTCDPLPLLMTKHRAGIESSALIYSHWYIRSGKQQIQLVVSVIIKSKTTAWENYPDENSIQLSTTTSTFNDDRPQRPPTIHTRYLSRLFNNLPTPDSQPQIIYFTFTT